jgi:hypothetical protein
VVVGVADPGHRHLHQHLAAARRVEVDGLDLPVLANSVQHCGLGFHDGPLDAQIAAGRVAQPRTLVVCARCAVE